jgi:hypothetical protein
VPEPSIYQTLWYNKITWVSAVQEKPDLSVIGFNLFDVNFLPQERESVAGRSIDPKAVSCLNAKGPQLLFSFLGKFFFHV